MLKILILDDELPICRGIELFLTQKGYDATIATLPSEALEQLNKSTFDILILDFKLPEMNGLAFMSVVKEKFSDIEIIMISGHGDMPRVIEAFRLGAIDFIPKPFSLTDIDVSIQRTGKFIELSNKLKISEGKTQKFLELKKRESTHGLIYASEAMKNVVNLIHLIADVEEVPVLITGESGTGKELVARKIFQTGSRRHNAFVTANCAAIPFDLFESEFFGHTKGAFTGAVSDQPGLFELADHGFLFLDEIGETDIRLQAKLLRAIETLEVKRIGAKKNIKINTRIIAATNQPLEKLVEMKKFRNDLYHRLSVFVIHIPPLRERKDDIIPLFEYFVLHAAKKIKKPLPTYQPEVINALLSYNFPGNARELKNMVERAMILSSGEQLNLCHFYFSGKTVHFKKTTQPDSTSDSFDLASIEKRVVENALLKTNYNKLQAARLLCITPQALRRRLEKYGIDSG